MFLWFLFVFSPLEHCLGGYGLYDLLDCSTKVLSQFPYKVARNNHKPTGRICHNPGDRYLEAKATAVIKRAATGLFGVEQMLQHVTSELELPRNLIG